MFMDGGVVVEQGPPASVLDDPQHERMHACSPRPSAPILPPAPANHPGPPGTSDR
jgi:hypothetical protein